MVQGDVSLWYHPPVLGMHGAHVHPVDLSHGCLHAGWQNYGVVLRCMDVATNMVNVSARYRNKGRYWERLLYRLLFREHMC